MPDLQQFLNAAFMPECVRPLYGSWLAKYASPYFKTLPEQLSVKTVA